jgi:hypothetical protein
VHVWDWVTKSIYFKMTKTKWKLCRHDYVPAFIQYFDCVQLNRQGASKTPKTMDRGMFLPNFDGKAIPCWSLNVPGVVGVRVGRFSFNSLRCHVVYTKSLILSQWTLAIVRVTSSRPYLAYHTYYTSVEFLEKHSSTLSSWHVIYTNNPSLFEWVVLWLGQYLKGAEAECCSLQ